MSKNSFKDKVGWITGASSGLGEAISNEFANKDPKLVLSVVMKSS